MSQYFGQDQDYNDWLPWRILPLHRRLAFASTNEIFFDNELEVNSSQLIQRI
jgi:hypothetical protein